MIAQVFLLLVLFQLKHWLCDYPFQTPYMLGKGAFRGWVFPLASHATVHLAGTATVMVVWAGLTGARWPFALALLPLADFAIHFSVDRLKASPALGGRWESKDRYFWWALGADQAAHHLTHYFIIFCLLRGQA